MSANIANSVCIFVTRGAVCESHHRASVAVVDTEGGVVLRNLALAMARLGATADQPGQRIDACARIRHAMARHPEMVAGHGHAVTRVLAQLGEQGIVKGGAEGVMTGCCPELGLGFAVKVDDGAWCASAIRRWGAVAGIRLPRC